MSSILESICDFNLYPTGDKCFPNVCWHFPSLWILYYFRFCFSCDEVFLLLIIIPYTSFKLWSHDYEGKHIKNLSQNTIETAMFTQSNLKWCKQCGVVLSWTDKPIKMHSVLNIMKSSHLICYHKPLCATQTEKNNRFYRGQFLSTTLCNPETSNISN